MDWTEIDNELRDTVIYAASRLPVGHYASIGQLGRHLDGPGVEIRTAQYTADIFCADPRRYIGGGYGKTAREAMDAAIAKCETEMSLAHERAQFDQWRAEKAARADEDCIDTDSLRSEAKIYQDGKGR